MKKSHFFAFLLITSQYLTGQIVYDNSCSSGLTLNFIGNQDAEDVFKERKGTLNYVNLILDERGLVYKGIRYHNIEDFESAYEPPNKILSKFDVLIGLEQSCPMAYLKRLFCAMNEIGPRKFDNVNVYFYRGKV
ncbi:MAG: hypothetical protein CMH48_07805 [Muricauda sp.]|nr:hypothetical protein [Allomuricauda sp.]MBC30737.1 hypothetical protein [Allomuricauda sp.]|tara:strand:- start:62021 stop:62422 length:402 start_codon:yes stop_codon:yes gene_type:complete